MQERVNESVRLISGARMNDQPRRLVHDQQVGILKQQVERNLFRLRVDCSQRRLDQPNDVTGANRLTRTCQLPSASRAFAVSPMNSPRTTFPPLSLNRCR